MLDTLQTLDALHDDEDELTQAVAAQSLINSGLAWSLEGSVGRACMDLIRAGACLAGREARRDTCGNTVAARVQLAAGTKGTVEFVAARKGDEWARAVADVA